jgi:hypothetical protein
MNGEAGKGDTYRPVNKKKWEEEYDRIFGKKPLNNSEDRENYENEKNKS